MLPSPNQRDESMTNPRGATHIQHSRTAESFLPLFRRGGIGRRRLRLRSGAVVPLVLSVSRFQPVAALSVRGAWVLCRLLHGANGWYYIRFNGKCKGNFQSGREINFQKNDFPTPYTNSAF